MSPRASFANAQKTALISDVAKRFKNISDREAPANHLSDKVYAAAQNQSMYNNSYQYVSEATARDQSKQEKEGAGARLKESRARLSQSVHAADKQ